MPPIPSDLAKEPLPLLLALSHTSVRMKMAGLLAVLQGVNEADRPLVVSQILMDLSTAGAEI